MCSSNNATVSITIDPVNDPPVLEFVSDFDFDEDLSTTITVSATDIDQENLDDLVYFCNPLGTNVSCDQIIDNEITFTSDLDWNGSEFVEICVRDDGLLQDTQNVEMKFKDKQKKFDPNVVYKGKPNPTKI